MKRRPMRSPRAAEAGMTILEVLVGIAILGLTSVAFLQGQVLVSDLMRKREGRAALWSLEQQVRSNTFGRMRDVVMASFDPANRCTPCETSIGAGGGAGGHVCRPLLEAFTGALASSPDGVPRYSTDLNVLRDPQSLAADLGGEPHTAQLLARCERQDFGRSGAKISGRSGLYGCLAVTASVPISLSTAVGMRAGSGRAATAGRGPSAAALPGRGGDGSGPGGAPLISSEEVPQTDLEAYLGPRRVIAEVEMGFYDQARDQAVTCEQFRRLAPGERALRLYYTLHLIEPRANGKAPRYDRVKGALIGRTDDLP